MPGLRKAIGFALAALTMLVAGPASASDPAFEADVARLRSVLGEVMRLTPEAIARLSVKDATRFVTTTNEVGLVVTHEVAARAKGTSGEEIGKILNAFYADNGLQAMVSPEFSRRLDLLTAKADKKELDASSRVLEARFPAYGNYLRRVRVKDAIARLDRAMKMVASLDAGNGPPKTIPDSVLQGARSAEGVRSAAYANGRFQLVFDDRVVDGGTLELQPIKLTDGKNDLRCVAAPEVQKYLPPTCTR